MNKETTGQKKKKKQTKEIASERVQISYLTNKISSQLYKYVQIGIYPNGNSVVKSTITDSKIFIRGTNSGLELPEDKICELGDRLIENKQPGKIENRMKKNKQSLKEMWDIFKCTNVHIMRVPEGEEEKKISKKNIRRNNG